MGLRSTLTYQNLLVRRVPADSILGLAIRTYRKVGFGSSCGIPSRFGTNIV